jgi:DNA-binding HxlR family transcriptional regulator
MDLADAEPEDLSADAEPEEAFSALGNETRMAILWALWNEREPAPQHRTGPAPFTELRRAVGVSDSGQFNYHLDKLVDGGFVEHVVHDEADADEDAARDDDDGVEGYVLDSAGVTLIRAIVKGSLTEVSGFADEPIGVACPHCGAHILLTYEDELLYAHCSNCEGSYGTDERAEGLLTALRLSPVALLDRTPEQAFTEALVWNSHRHLAMMRGSCPECAGTVESTPEICEDHDAGDGEVCSTCGSVHPVRVRHVCTVCQFAARLGLWLHALSNPVAQAFFARHNYDVLGADYFRVGPETIDRQTVEATDPLRVSVEFVASGDSLAVTLDETGNVCSVDEAGTAD